MATSAFKSAFDIIEATPNELSSQEQMNREPRYLFFAGDEPNMPDPGGMMVQSPVIPGKTIWRCAVTPAISVPVKMRREEIPDGRLLDGTDNGKGIASMLLPCGPEVDALLADYGHPDRTQWQKRWGLVELEELRGMAPRDVAKMNLTTTFFPSWPDVPKTNREVIALVEAKNAELLAIIEKRNGTEREQLLLAIGTRMLAAVQQAQSYHTKLIQNGNTKRVVKLARIRDCAGDRRCGRDRIGRRPQVDASRITGKRTGQNRGVGLKEVLCCVPRKHTLASRGEDAALDPRA